jgi:hypothetical protein
MAKLEYTKKTFKVVDYCTLEKLIEEEYGKEYSFAASEECVNDSEHEFEVRAEPLDKWQAGAIIDFKRHGGNCSARALMQDMVNRKVMEPGRYLISVSW